MKFFENIVLYLYAVFHPSLLVRTIRSHLEVAKGLENAKVILKQIGDIQNESQNVLKDIHNHYRK